MIKKLISLVCCLVPMGVKAAPALIEPVGGDAAVATTYDAWQGAITNGQSVVVTGGNGINAVGGGTIAPGFSIANTMSVGELTNPGTADVEPIVGKLNNLYVLNSVVNPFTVLSKGDVSIGSVLQVLNGMTLGFKSPDATRFNLSVGSGGINEGVRVGGDGNLAAMDLANIDVLTVNGSVIAYGDFSVDANSVDVGGINVNAGNMNIVAADSVRFNQIVSGAAAGTVNVQAGTTITSAGTIQNSADSMELVAAGGISVAGNLENTVVSDNAEFSVSGGDLVVSGTMKNDSDTDWDATLTLNVANLTVVGGSNDSYSFVNTGNFYANVAGVTHLEYGLNLSGMKNDNEFSLTTGSLEFGSGADSDTWFSAFSNNLNKFNVNITDDDLTLATVLNGAGVGDAFNIAATMSVQAQNITADSVQNNAATLSMMAAQDMTIFGAVIGNSGQTKLVATDALVLNGAVSNSAGMTLNGKTVELASVSNSGAGANLTISSLPSNAGAINIAGGVTNTSGTVSISAKNIDIAGVVRNNSGTMDINGSDLNGGPIAINALNAAGGVINVGAKAGSVDIANAMTVSGATLNLGADLYNVTVGGRVDIAGNLNAATAGGVAGDVNVAATGNVPFVMSSDDSILIGGDINVVDTQVRQIKLDAPLINVTGNATVKNSGYLTLGTVATTYVRVVGDLTANNGGVFESFADDLFVGAMSGDSKFIMHGENITANAGDIDIAGNLYFDAVGDPVNPDSGLVVQTTDNLTLKTTADGADINVASVSVGVGNILNYKSADAVNIAGVVSNKGTIGIDAGGDLNVTGVLTNSGTLNAMADSVTLAGVNNTGDVEIVSSYGAVSAGDFSTNNSLVVQAATDIVAGAAIQTGGVMDLTADTLSLQSLSVTGAVGTQANLDAETVEIAGAVDVAGDVVQGGSDGMLNLGVTDFMANGLTIGGNLAVQSGNTTYDVVSGIAIAGDVDVANGAIARLDAGAGVSGMNLTNAGMLGLLSGGSVRLANITNSGDLTIDGAQGVVAANVINNTGILAIDSGTGVFTLDDLVINSGNMTVQGVGMSAGGRMDNIATLCQNFIGGLTDGDVNIIADDYVITTAGLNVGAINQDGKLRINTSDVLVGGDIVADDLQFVAQLGDGWSDNNSQLPWIIADVGGSVSGGVKFIGLEKMDVGVNYTFSQDSVINAAILPYAAGVGSTDINYWSTVSLAEDNTLGDITNAQDGRALIEVGGKFISGVEYDYQGFELDAGGVALGAGQIGIDLFNVVDQGTAIWLVHAGNGVENFGQLEQLRNLDVRFCNADGSLCYNYLDSLRVKNDVDLNGADSDLPAYVSVRDTDDDGVADSLYVVFDPRFGGPVLLENLKIQDVVAREPVHTDGEYVSAGALDNMLIGQAYNKKFLNGAPLEIVPIIFQGTNMEEMANQLYNRMEHYVETAEGEALARFSRLFQVREVEQIAGAVALNEHTTFRSFEDRMFDEFIWNRNRNLNKAWLDVDYGMFYQNIDDGKHTDGNRFAVSGGFDWQESNTLQLGLAGRVSYTKSSADDAMDLSYTGYSEQGKVAIDVADTNVGLGGYLMKTLGEKSRLYGNVFADLHLFDVDRTQNYVSRIDGDGLAFSLISEWGLMHDILNQYVVGNAYARVGYNFGFSVKEKAAGDDYMRLKSDGYFVLIPGYSLVAQKRIYPSAWFQIRPYASIGVEYDVFGAPDFAKYKFVTADDYTKYDIDINPLWANIGGGVELLSAHGIQFGVDYRYQYNDAIQLHNIKISGSYRF